MHESTKVRIPGYDLSALLYESEGALIFRARRQLDDLPVVLKALKQEYPSARDMARCRWEYELGQELLGVPGVLGVHGLLEHQNAPVLVLEDFGGESLKRLLEREKIGLAQVLTLAIQIADCLRHLHAARIIHKDINPGNILYNPETGILKLIDFGIASRATRESGVLCSPEGIEGSLPYISPEQTGRMNRLLDFRTDFYSFGVTLYEMLTGSPPFSSSDPLELVHYHLAKDPQPPHARCASVPLGLSLLVLKLLEKTAEQRYKSAWGIKQDLEACQRMFQETGDIPVFQLGEKDLSDRLFLPQKLYGRDEPLTQLRQGFERSIRGLKELTLLSGESGVGKTVLVQELYRSLAEQNAFFTSGKYNQLKRDQPYLGLAMAFQQLVRYLLTETESQIGKWREKLLFALGPNGGLIVDLVPEVARIIGPQPRIEELPPIEAQNRFSMVLQKFLGVFTRAEHPLVIFLDDMQWADSASLGLLEVLMGSPDCQYLYLILAFRDNEVSATHPLLQSLNEITKVCGSCERIVVRPLGREQVNELIGEALGALPARVRPLSDLVMDKTEGNPFFVRELLVALHDEKLLWFDFEGGLWQWDLLRIRSWKICDNVVELMEQRIKRLPRESQEVLEMAACLGNRFDLQTLSIIHERSPEETEAHLQAALGNGLILPTGEAPGVVDPEESAWEAAGTKEYMFAHDRVQQAAYQLIGEAERPDIHHRIGMLLILCTPEEQRAQRILDVVNHLNMASSCLETRAEREELAGFNLTAGKRAKASAAYLQAYRYLEKGITLLGREGWQKSYDLMRALAEEGAEAALLCGEREAMQKRVGDILENARSPLHKVKAYLVSVNSSAAQNDFPEAIRAGLTILGLLGVKFPEHPGKARVLLGYLRTKLALSHKKIERLLELPEMTDVRRIAAITIIGNLASTVYFSRPNLFALMMFQRVQSLLRYGNNSWSSTVYESFAIVLCGLAGDIETGYRLGRLADELVARYDNGRAKARTLVIFNTFIRHWKEHVSSCIAPLEEAHRIAFDNGDLEYGANASSMCCQLQFYLGKDLGELEKLLFTHGEQMQRLKLESTYNYTGFFRQLVASLRDPTSGTLQLKGKHPDEEALLEHHQKANDRMALFLISYVKLVWACLNNQYAEAIAHADRAAIYTDSAHGFFHLSRFRFYDSLARLNAGSYLGRAEQRKARSRVAKNQRALSRWARHAPMNHAHLHLLIEAERCRVMGDTREASALYDRAIALAREHAFLPEEAQAYELAALFYEAQGRTTIARSYAQEALFAYQRWGASGKVQQIEQRHGRLVARPRGPGHGQASTALSEAFSTSTARISDTGNSLTRNLDLTSIMKAAQGISGEIVLDDLLHKLMLIVGENAGAERGFLIMEKNGILHGVAEFSIRAKDRALVHSIPLEEISGLSKSIVRYVYRFSEPVILGDALNEGHFTNDPYVVENRIRSVLCMPILHHGALTGALYLENGRTAQAFSHDRLEVLGVLVSQAAISIENAKLYGKLQNALRQAEESARIKSEFLNKTTHELRTPLNAIINLPEGMLASMSEVRQAFCGRCQARFTLDEGEEVGSETSCPRCQAPGTLAVQEEVVSYTPLRDFQKYLGCVRDEGHALLALVNQLLDLSALERRGLSLRLERLDLGSFLSSALDRAQIAARPRDIVITALRLPGAVPFSADPDRLGQILSNLLSNAVKYSPEGSEVTIAVEHDETSVTFAVRDHGIGIPQDKQRLIFEGFRQADGGSTRRYGGMGLGLAITKQLVELHGGQIWLESEPGMGSAFFVKIPRTQGEKPSLE